MFQGGMLIRTLPTTLLQIFCKIILNSQVIIKSIIDPDNNLVELLSINGSIKVYNVVSDFIYLDKSSILLNHLTLMLLVATLANTK